MVNNDFLMKQIDSLELGLRALLSKRISVSDNSTETNHFGFTNESLKKKINVDLLEIIDIPDNLLIELLLSKGFTPSNLNDIIHIIFYLTNKNQKSNAEYDANVLFRKSLVIETYLNQVLKIAFFNTESLLQNQFFK